MMMMMMMMMMIIMVIMIIVIINTNDDDDVNQVRAWETGMDWYRSKSTTRLNSEDSDDTVSTLSDEDSTPHVSRSVKTSFKM